MYACEIGDTNCVKELLLTVSGKDDVNKQDNKVKATVAMIEE